MSPLLKFEVTFDEYSHLYASLQWSADRLEREKPTHNYIPQMRHLAERLRAESKAQLSGD